MSFQETSDSVLNGTESLKRIDMYLREIHNEMKWMKESLNKTQEDLTDIRLNEQLKYNSSTPKNVTEDEPHDIIEEWNSINTQNCDSSVQYSIGLMYEKGFGTEQDYTNAAKWFQIAITNGNINALMNLGYLYDTGLGVNYDARKAMNFYLQYSRKNMANFTMKQR